MKVKVAVLGSPSLISLICGRKETLNEVAVQSSEVGESRSDRPGLPAPNKPYLYT